MIGEKPKIPAIEAKSAAKRVESQVNIKNKTFVNEV